jgi:hypothetical protein
MNEKDDAMDRSRRKLEGIAQVMEVLETPLLQHSYSSTLSKLQQLLEFMPRLCRYGMQMAISPLLLLPYFRGPCAGNLNLPM